MDCSPREIERKSLRQIPKAFSFLVIIPMRLYAQHEAALEFLFSLLVLYAIGRRSLQAFEKIFGRNPI